MFFFAFLAFAASFDVDATPEAGRNVSKRECLERFCPVSTQFPSLDCPTYDAATCSTIDEVREEILDQFMESGFAIDANGTLEEEGITPSTMRLLRCMRGHAALLRECLALTDAPLPEARPALQPAERQSGTLASPAALERCVAEMCPLSPAALGTPEGLACPVEESRCLEMISHIRVELANMTISGRLSDRGAEIPDALDGLSCIRDRRASLEACSQALDPSSGRVISGSHARLVAVADSVLEACLASSCPLEEQVLESGLNCSGVLLPGCAALQSMRLSMMRTFREKGFHMGALNASTSKRAQVLPKCMEDHREELQECVEGAQKFAVCSEALCPVAKHFPALDCTQAPDSCAEVRHVVGELAREYADAGYPQGLNDSLPADSGLHTKEAEEFLLCFVNHSEELRACSER